MKKEYDQLILEHYKKIAKNFQADAKSTMEDQFIRSAEVLFFTQELRHHFGDKEFSLLDAGCGNGYVLSVLREQFPKAKLYGLEFTPELFAIARDRQLPNTEIQHGDLRQINWFSEHKFDVVMTERVIINILDKKDQYQATANLMSRLKPNGFYFLSESFREPLDELNRGLSEMCLAPIDESYQNLYLRENFAHNIRQFGLEEIKTQTPSNYLSTHFYVSRVFHKSVRPEGGKVKFSRMVDFFVEALPPAVGNYSPILFKSFQKLHEGISLKEIYSQL